MGNLSVCTTCLVSITGISRKKIGFMKRWVTDGLVEAPPLDAPTDHLVGRDNPQHRHADSWLAWIYHTFAEHRADVKVPGIDDHCTDASKPPEFNPSSLDLPQAEEGGGVNLPVKFMPPGRLAELFESALLAPSAAWPPSQARVRPSSGELFSRAHFSS